MPRSVEFNKNSYNQTLYEDLLRLVQSWPEVQPQQAELIAINAAHQSDLAQKIRAGGLNQEKDAGKRKRDVTRFRDALLKARDIWSEMENDDQKKLSSCLEDLKNSSNPGHELVEDTTYEQFLKIYGNTYPIAEWRKKELSQHRNWGLDIEMLDLLIGNAELWLRTKAPKPQERHDPRLYAVKFLADVCEQNGIPASHAEKSKFTKIVTMYLNHTYPGDKNSSYPIGMIQKANELRASEPDDFFAPGDDDLFYS